MTQDMYPSGNQHCRKGGGGGVHDSEVFLRYGPKNFFQVCSGQKTYSLYNGSTPRGGRCKRDTVKFR